MNKQNKEYRKYYEARYKNEGFRNKRKYETLTGYSHSGTPCYYCGDEATDADHSIPLIYLHGLYQQGYTVIPDKLVKVPACRECNGFLSAKLFNDLEERKQYVKECIYKKYKKDLDLPDWSIEEVEEMSYALTTSILEGLSRRKRAHDRLCW